MYNYYKGNSGVVKKVQEPERKSGRNTGQNQRQNVSHNQREYRSTAPKSQRGNPGSTRSQGSGIFDKFGELIPKTLGSLETEDIILLLILYLMYRDSGDTELLIIMGAFLFL